MAVAVVIRACFDPQRRSSSAERVVEERARAAAERAVLVVSAEVLQVEMAAAEPVRRLAILVTAELKLQVASVARAAVAVKTGPRGLR